MEEAPTVESAHKAWSEFDPSNHVRLLGQSGAKVCVDSNVSPARYVRAMNQLEKTTLYYLKNGKQEEAYVLLNKLITIYIEKLPAHPGYKNLDKKSLAEGKKIVRRAFPVAEELKTNLTQKLQTLKDNSLQQLEIRRIEFSNSTGTQAADSEERDFTVGTGTCLVNTEQAVVTDSNLPTSKSEEEPEPTVSPSPLSSSPPPSYSPPAHAPISSRGSVKQLVHSYSKLLTQAESVESFTKPSFHSEAATPQKNDHRSSHMHTCAVGPMSSRWTGGGAPLPNPLFSLPSHLAATTTTLASPTSNLLTSSLNIGLGGLRNVVIPQDIRQKFESLSQSNSMNKIETCGILCGVLRDSGEGEIILITHLVLPKQSGGPDSCDTLDEHELFEFQDKNDLITAGWIHTHPTQTAFLSSVDQHTHASYQILLDEAVALVLAPKYDNMGVFSLTSPHGLSYVNSCRKTGFHPHPKVPPLFDTCSHVHFASSLSIQTVDLR